MPRRIFTIPFFFALSLVASDVLPPPDDKLEDPVITFRSDVSLARVDSQVVDQDNRPIRGLQAQDFVLRESGKQQEIRDVQSEKVPVDVLLLLDVSRSMEPHVQRIAAASHQALRALRDQDRVAIMVFDRSTRISMPFRASLADAERGLQRVLEQETFEGGTDITTALLEAAGYMQQHARREARRAIVILTDDQTERDRNEAAVASALSRADSILSAIIAPDALHTGTASRTPALLDDERLRELFGDMLPPGFGSFGVIGPRTRAAGTSRIAQTSGGDSTVVTDASAFEDTLARLRERYALYFYLPEGAGHADQLSVEVELSEAVRQRFPGATVRYRRTQLRPEEPANGTDNPGPVRVSFPSVT